MPASSHTCPSLCAPIHFSPWPPPLTKHPVSCVCYTRTHTHQVRCGARGVAFFLLTSLGDINGKPNLCAPVTAPFAPPTPPTGGAPVHTIYVCHALRAARASRARVTRWADRRFLQRQRYASTPPFFGRPTPLIRPPPPQSPILAVAEADPALLVFTRPASVSAGVFCFFWGRGGWGAFLEAPPTCSRGGRPRNALPPTPTRAAQLTR